MRKPPGKSFTSLCGISIQADNSVASRTLIYVLKLRNCGENAADLAWKIGREKLHIQPLSR
jgi:hypothetical protein